jgi:plasmid stabilization system protein ParE
MVKQVIWSRKAQNDQDEILHYWRKRNKSNEYSKKLRALFKAATKMIAAHPKIGRATELLYRRSKIVSNYKIIYRETETHIEILTIRDTRRNPDD